MPFPSCLGYFNSRPSARGDQRACWLAADGANISIHAPPRGATTWATGVSRFTVFQFTPLREGRPLRRAFLFFPFVFQFTPLREGRRAKCCPSRPAPSISIHAPPRGATEKKDQENLKRALFQFTPLREGRLFPPATPRLQAEYFNSRPSARGDRNRGSSGQNTVSYFNSRPSARGDS